MRMIFFAMLMAWMPFIVYAQGHPNNPPKDAKVRPIDPEKSLKKAEKSATTPATPSPEAEKIASERAQHKQQLLSGNEVLQRYLGVSSTKDPEYAARKEKLFNENPTAYQQMQTELRGSGNASKRKISKAEYNNFSEEKRAIIDANPHKYEIVD